MLDALGAVDLDALPPKVAFGALLLASLATGAWLGAEMAPPPPTYGPAELLWLVGQVASLALVALVLRGIRRARLGRTSSRIVSNFNDALLVGCFVHGGAVLAVGARYQFFGGSVLVWIGALMVLAGAAACLVYAFGGRSS